MTAALFFMVSVISVLGWIIKHISFKALIYYMQLKGYKEPVSIAKIMREHDITLAEANEIIYELGCILKNAEKHSPNSLLKNISDFTQELELI